MTNDEARADGVLAVRSLLRAPRVGRDGTDDDLGLIRRVLQLAASTEESTAEITLGEPTGTRELVVEARVSGSAARVLVQRLGELSGALEVAGQAVRGIGFRGAAGRSHIALPVLERVQERMRRHLEQFRSGLDGRASDAEWLRRALDRTRATSEMFAEAGAARLSITVGGWRRVATA